MSSKASEIIEVIKEEVDRAEVVQWTFVRATCLLETHFHGRPSSLTELCPDLRGESLTEAQVKEMKQALVRLIEEAPSHDCVPGAVRLLALTGDSSQRDFLVGQLKRQVGWRHPAAIFELLLALEEIGEKVFFEADDKFIGSRSCADYEVNLEVAKRYLEKHDCLG